jgi:hypothetical protein
VWIYLALLQRKKEHVPLTTTIFPRLPLLYPLITVQLLHPLSLSLSLSDPDWKAIHYTSFPCPNDSSHPRAELTIRHQITRSRYMEQPHPLLASSSKSTTTPFYLALDQRAASASSPPADEVPTPPPTASDPFKQSSNEGGSEIIKAKIMSHPLYPALLKAFIDCRKVRTN